MDFKVKVLLFAILVEQNGGKNGIPKKNGKNILTKKMKMANIQHLNKAINEFLKGRSRHFVYEKDYKDRNRVIKIARCYCRRFLQRQGGDTFSLTEYKFKKVFNNLPDHVQLIAIQWGGGDTVFGDEAYAYINKNKDRFKEICEFSDKTTEGNEKKD